MAQIDYLPVANDAGSNVDSQANFAGSGYQTTGFVSGIVLSVRLNKVLRQSSMWAAVMAHVASDGNGAVDVLDDGDLEGKIALMESAISGLSNAPRRFITDASGVGTVDGTIYSEFEVRATGDIGEFSVANLVVGKHYTFYLRQDGSGNHAFHSSTIPMPDIAGGTDASAPNAYAAITFGVTADGTMRALSPMMIS